MQVAFTTHTPLQNPSMSLLKISEHETWNMPFNQSLHINCILQLLYARRIVRIKTLLIYFAQSLSCSMLYFSQYKAASPWIFTILALLSIITLSWLSWCQQKQIEYLSKSIIELCVQSPSSNPGDGLHEDWKPENSAIQLCIARNTNQTENHQLNSLCQHKPVSLFRT